MPRGNPNPSPETRFKPGTVANPRGKTSEQRAAEIRNAQIATEIRGKMLDVLHSRVMDDATGSQAIAAIAADVLRLLKDTEDRGLGTPKASVDVTTNGKDLPGVIDLNSLSSEALAEIVAAHDAATKPD